jgi:pilus assembly protein Flp/PilA
MSKKANRSSPGSTLALLRARIASDEHGATAIEYALVASGIGAAVAATVWSLGTTTNGLYASISTLLP